MERQLHQSAEQAVISDIGPEKSFKGYKGIWIGYKFLNHEG